jgi:hypothetical protein
MTGSDNWIKAEWAEKLVVRLIAFHDRSHDHTSGMKETQHHPHPVQSPLALPVGHANQLIRTERS